MANKNFKIGETISIIFNAVGSDGNTVDLSGYDIAVELFTPFSPILKKSGSDIKILTSSSFSVQFKATETATINAGMLNTVLTLTKGDVVMKGKASPCLLLDAYAPTCNCSSTEETSLNLSINVGEDVISCEMVMGTTMQLIGDMSGIRAVYFEKIGINSLIYPKYFRYSKERTVDECILAGNATSATLLISGVPYTHETIEGVTIPADTDLILSDIDIAAGCDTGALTLTFK